jgi:xanthine dehydrogenase accessory factor
MEPHLPPSQLLLIGDSPVITALQQLASVLDFAIIYLDSADLSEVQINERTYILVATHGQYDEDVLEQVLRSSAIYVGMVGSRRRTEDCRAYLRASGLTEQQIAHLKAPAGLDIGAITPEEIAASILAELIQVKRHKIGTSAQSGTSEKVQHDRPGTVTIASTAIDPVCGMMVETATARHRSIYGGREFYFCCPACKRLFEQNPQEYLIQHEREV